MKKEAYLVEGMTCSGCERTVSKVISNIEGVASAKAVFNKILKVFGQNDRLQPIQKPQILDKSGSTF